MSDYKEYTVLDGTNPTLDASELSYELLKGKIYVKKTYNAHLISWSGNGHTLRL